MTAPVSILVCSPRKKGNSDTVAAWLCEAFTLPVEVRRIAEAPVYPCTSCGHCMEYPGSCSLDVPGDNALFLLGSLMAGPAACLVSPIYFYHLPAQAKALVDRCQRYWKALPSGRGTPLGAILLAGRSHGEQLFHGAELTLRFMAYSLGLKPIPPLCLYGTDTLDNLSKQREFRERIQDYALELERTARA